MLTELTVMLLVVDEIELVEMDPVRAAGVPETRVEEAISNSSIFFCGQ